MEFSAVLERFLEIAKLPHENEDKYQNLIKISIDETYKILKDGVSIDENILILTELASVMGYYRYMVMQGTTTQRVVSNDININVDFSKKITIAKNLLNNTLLLSHHLIKDPEFFVGLA